MVMTVSNDEYEAALANDDYIKIGRSVLKQFRLDVDERKEAWLKGLWDALKKYNPAKAKFTSYLYRCVFYRALKMAYKKPPKLLKEAKTFNNDSVYNWTNEQSNLVIDRVLGRLTFQELSKKYNLSVYLIKKQLKKDINKIKKDF